MSKYDKMFYRNIHTGAVMSESEYNAMVEKEAKAYWKENINDCNSDYISFEDFREDFLANDGDFKCCDKEGNDIDWSEY